MIVLALAAVSAFEGYEVDLVTDLSITFSLAGASIFLAMEPSAWEGTSPCDGLCDPGGINFIDRWVTNNNSELARDVSDVLLTTMFALPIVAMLHNPNDTVVGYQALAGTTLLTQLFKLLVRRPRPLAYNATFAEEIRFDGDAQLSFPSGHSSLAFASATVFALPLIWRDDASLRSFVAATAAYAVASFVGTLRVLGGKHFVTDVLAGAAIGVAVGALVSFSHRGEATAPKTGQNEGALVRSFGFGVAW